MIDPRRTSAVAPRPRLRRTLDACRATSRAAAALLVIVPTLALATAPAAVAAPAATVLLGRNNAGEFQGVRGPNFLAWQENTRRHPGQYNVFARPIEGGKKFRVNAAGTGGANGGIEGDLLAYQQFTDKRSDIQFYDLAKKKRSSPPKGVNTSDWEYWPSISGSLLLFGRLTPNDTRRIVLFDLTTRDSKVLAKVKGKDAFMAPGQVDGDWATWSRCPAGHRCDVYLYRISTGTKTKIPNKGFEQRAPSVAPDGTVFFARAKNECGTGVRLISYPPGGPDEEQWRVPGGDDIGTTRVYVGSDGQRTVYFDQYSCTEAAVSDVWQLGESATPHLTVKVDGEGKVTSSPAGIDCGTDCDETFQPGATVTLTAEALGTSKFGGWTGDCAGTGLTCTVTMNGPRSVTATFSPKPVLTVTKNGTGQGTVTSSPAGISCGTDCAEPYDPGTSVTLSATPVASSQFVGWGGACSGTGSCVVAMDSSKAVTATFTVKPVLTVTIAGGGQGTVTGPGINCPGDCIETYDLGTSVSLSATPGGNDEFGGWGGACSGTGACNLTMDTSKSVSATFGTKPALNVTIGGTGGGTVTGNGINCPTDCTQTYATGTVVPLSAAPDSSSTFGGWSGDCSGTGSCSVTMNANHAVTATFDPTPQFTLSVSIGGSGGGSVTGSGINCPGTCSLAYDQGTVVGLTASPDGSSTFGGWGGDCSGTGSCSVTMNANHSVSATFDTTPPQQFTLSVTVGGSGSGTVTGNGISCPGTCSVNLDAGTNVSLGAAADVGSTFTGWGGDCSGTAACTFTMNSAHGVSATFDLAAPKTGAWIGFVPSVRRPG